MAHPRGDAREWLRAGGATATASCTMPPHSRRGVGTMASMFSTLKGRYALRDRRRPGHCIPDGSRSATSPSAGNLAQVPGAGRLAHAQGGLRREPARQGRRLPPSPRSAQYTLGAILRAAEGSWPRSTAWTAPTTTSVPQFETCPTVTMWRDLGKVTASYLDSKTLQDIVDQMHERADGAAEDLRALRTSERTVRQQERRTSKGSPCHTARRPPFPI